MLLWEHGCNCIFNGERYTFFDMWRSKLDEYLYRKGDNSDCLGTRYILGQNCRPTCHFKPHIRLLSVYNVSTSPGPYAQPVPSSQQSITMLQQNSMPVSATIKTNASEIISTVNNHSTFSVKTLSLLLQPISKSHNLYSN